MKSILILLFSTTLSLGCFAQLEEVHYGVINGGGDLNPGLVSNQEALEHFQENRFGMFIHWGPVTLRGTEIGWSRGREVPTEEYDNLYKEFNPVLFDADAWVQVAKDAGMKYIVITSKHHDGFRLWPTEYSEYDMMSTPFKRDILRELADACKKHGLDFGVYYTILDWHSPDYETRRNEEDKRPVDFAKMKKHIDLMKNELTEIVENYDPFLIWFDGQWERSFTREMGADLYAHLRSLKHDIVINDRVDKSHDGPHKDEEGNTILYAGDYHTPEQRVGEYNVDTPWETCMTICQQWAWKPNDKMKPLETSLKTLSSTVGGGGNLLYNVGPMLDGRIEARQVEMLRKMGAWLKENGQAVYATKGGPYKPSKDFVSTRKGKTIYIHLHNPDLALLELPLPENAQVKALNGNCVKAYKVQDGTLNIELKKTSGLLPVVAITLDINTENITINKSE